MGYRASRQATTKHSPYYIRFQQHMHLPIDNEVLPRDDQDRNQKIRYLWRKLTLQLQNKSKRRHQLQVISEGTELLLQNTYQKQ